MFEVEVGSCYLVPSSVSKQAICIHKLGQGRALFVLPANKITPFVAWYYSKLPYGDNSLKCGGGEYYETLIDAIKGEDICL